MSLITKYKFPVVNISQFYPRPGTPAAKMKRIATQIVKDRSRRLTTLFESFDPYIHLIDRVEKVWFSTEISEDGHHSVGHTKGYVKVLVPLDGALPGMVRFVKIRAAKRFHIEGEVTAAPAGHRRDVPVDTETAKNTLTQWSNTTVALTVLASLSLSAILMLKYRK